MKMFTLMLTLAASIFLFSPQQTDAKTHPSWIIWYATIAEDTMVGVSDMTCSGVYVQWGYQTPYRRSGNYVCD